MRVVLDTNVIVSGSISPHGVPGRLLAAWEAQTFDLLVSAALLIEYRRALGYEKVRSRHRKNDAELDELIGRYRRFGTLIEPEERLAVVAGDPDDDRVLECAVAGKATQIVTGDPHLLRLGSYREIPILTPRAFVELLEPDEGA